MRRRQIQLLRDEIRRTLNTEQAVEASPALSDQPAPVLENPKRGRPPKVKHDDIAGRSDAGRRSARKV